LGERRVILKFGAELPSKSGLASRFADPDAAIKSSGKQTLIARANLVANEKRRWTAASAGTSHSALGEEQNAMLRNLAC
jgi:hypothetical protein